MDFVHPEKSPPEGIAGFFASLLFSFRRFDWRPVVAERICELIPIVGTAIYVVASWPPLDRAFAEVKFASFARAVFNLQNSVHTAEVDFMTEFEGDVCHSVSLVDFGN